MMFICTVSNPSNSREKGVVSGLMRLEILCCLHRRQPLTQDRIFLSMSGQKYIAFIM